MANRKSSRKITSILKGTVKDVASKVDPFNKPIDKNDTSNTGTESIKLAEKAVKKGYGTVKTAKRGIKTTARTIKTTEKVAKATVTVVYKTTVNTVKFAIATIKFTGTVISNVVALAVNPITYIALAILLVLVITSLSFIIIFSSLSAGNASNVKAQSSAAGLDDVPAQYEEALIYLDEAKHNNAFTQFIDSLYFNTDDLKNSDLIYMVKFTPDDSEELMQTIYQRSLATDERKDTLKSAAFSVLTDQEIIAIAYVYLEKQKNDAKHTTRQIYKVEFSQSGFTEIIDKCLTYSDTYYERQECPDQNCSYREEPNPEYETARNNANNMYNGGYMGWLNYIIPLIEHNHHDIHDGAAQATDWEYNIQWEIDNWLYYYGFTGLVPYYDNDGWDFLNNDIYNTYLELEDIANNTPETIRQPICEHLHDMHSVGLYVLTKEQVMSALGFEEADIQWVELTVQGFENNPDLS